MSYIIEKSKIPCYYKTLTYWCIIFIINNINKNKKEKIILPVSTRPSQFSEGVLLVKQKSPT